MDISDTLAPKSDQLDAVELIGQPRTFTITNVTAGNVEQPVSVHLADFPRVWRPSKSMRRVLAACWGTDASQWAGRRVRLYCDERVTFGSDVVGGTRISHLSNIDKRKSIPLLVKRGKSASFTVEPLADEPAADASPEARIAKLRAGWQTANPQQRAAIEAEVSSLLSGKSEPANGLPVEDPPEPEGWELPQDGGK